MRIELNSRLKSVCFIVGSALVLSPYLWWIQNHYRASAAAADVSQSGLQSAVRLEPSSAEYHDLLGRFYLFAAQDAKKAEPELQTAANLDAHSSRYWLDLATARGLLTDTAGQRRALQTALQVDPKTPQVAWEAGNFFLLDGETIEALDSFKTVVLYDTVQFDPIALRAALELCWRATRDAPAILQHAMPAKVEPHLELLRILVDRQQTEAVMATWRSLVQLDQPYKVSDAVPFVDYLIRQRDVQDAQEMWTSLAKQSASLRVSTTDGNLIVNGSFDEEIVPGGFSWRLAPPAINSLRIDTSEFHGSGASVSFRLDGPAFADYGFYQLVPVKPHQTYELEVWAKSEEIQSAEGPRLIAEDAYTHAPLAQGPEWLGTHGWNQEHIMFTTSPDTILVRIYLGRSTGNGLIRGTLWLDDFRLYGR